MIKNNSLTIAKGVFGALILALFTYLVSAMFIKSGYLNELRSGMILGGVVSLVVTYYLLIIFPELNSKKRSIMLKKIGLSMAILVIFTIVALTFGLYKTFLNVPMFCGFGISYVWMFFVSTILFKILDLIPNAKK